MVEVMKGHENRTRGLLGGDPCSATAGTTERETAHGEALAATTTTRCPRCPSSLLL